MDAIQVLQDFKTARTKKKDWMVVAKEDFEFALGKQWEDKDVKDLESRGVKALTINKIQPNLFLISGIQRQNRSDFRAFPEGEEDGVTADIATMLLKNVMKRCYGEYKLSEQFEDGVICGEGWLEPYIDYTHDLINGELKLKKVPAFNVFIDPASTEFDISDAEYAVKFSPGLSENQLIKLFPKKKAMIKKIGEGTIDIDNIGGSLSTEQTDEYDDYSTDAQGFAEIDAKTYDLVEYYYKKYVPAYYVATKNPDKLIRFKTKREAEAMVEKLTERDTEDEPSAVFIERLVPEIWVCSVVGSTLIEDVISPFYPRWKGYPLIPYWAHKNTTPIDKKEYMVQGVVRSLKDPQIEVNKRRTQELRHLNSSANSGWLTEEDSWVDGQDVEKFGSTPGINLEYKKGLTNKPERITPAPLSQGHAQLVAENSQDMKEISGINADLLAMNEKTQSGRAIHLRQQQGIVMIQRVVDNFGLTKKLLAQFILSQLGELYTVETAVRVCGNGFIKDNFEKPVVQQVQDPMTGQMIQKPAVDENNELIMQVDPKDVEAVFNMVLNDTEVGKYDVSVGEGANSETVRFSNYMLLMELVEKGVPIPPDILIEESLIASASKEKIKKSIAAAQEAQARANAVKPA